MIKMKKYPLKEYAAIKFEKGRIEYKGKQDWDFLTIDYLKQELRDEIADAYNYSSHWELLYSYKYIFIRFLLRVIYKLI